MIEKKIDRTQKIYACLPALAIMLISGAVHGLEIDTTYSAGIGVSDNITRVASNEIDETMGVLGLDFGLSQESRRLRADVRSQFDYVYYADGTFDNELIGGLAGTLDFTLIDERLTWIVQDNFGQQTSDPLAPANPGNREDVNFFSTGPTINLLPGSRNFVQLNFLYSNVQFEERESDDERFSSELQLGREIRRGARLSLNASTERVEFDDGGMSSDFDRLEGFVRFALTGNRNTLDLDLGYTEIDSDLSISDGVLVRLNWTRQVSADTTFTMSGGTSFSDQGNIFQFDQNRSTDLRETTDVFSTSIPFTANFVNAGYTLNRGSTSFNIGIRWQQEDYDGGPPIDRNTTGADFSLRRDINQSVYARFGLQYERRNFKYLNIADDNVSGTAEFGYRFGPFLSVSLLYGYSERSGDSAASESRENRLFLRLSYSPNRSRQ